MEISQLRERVESLGFATSNQRDGFRSKCPCCKTSRKDKFGASQSNGKLLVKCHGGCTVDDICTSLDIAKRDLFSHSNGSSRPKQTRSYESEGRATGVLKRSVHRQHSDAELSGRWQYVGVDGSVVAVVVRFDYATGKTYRQLSQRDGSWVCKAPEHRILYRLNELSECDVLWIHEGEKSADTGWSIALPSTTAMGGSKQAHLTDYSSLNGKTRVYLCPDTGDDGEHWLRDVIAAIRKLDSPPELLVCRFPFEESNCDIVDWLEGIATDDEEAIQANLLELCSPLHVDDFPSDESDEESDEPSLVRIAHRWASDIEAESVKWLWRGFIPQTGITFLDGDPEAGKTCCALDIIGRITRGERMPGDEYPQGPGVAAILAKEDRYENTIKPRLEAAGADMTRVSCIDHIEVEMPKGIEKQFLTLPRHAHVLASHLQSIKATLLLIDPYDNHLDDNLRTASSTDMRKAFTPITEAASAIECALLIIRHFGKRDYGNAKHKGIGSIGLTAVSYTHLTLPTKA